MTRVEQTQLLVVGGGPVGLIAALCAAKRGLDVIVLERSFRGTARGHTTLLHPSSIRLLSELGLAPLLLRSGQLLEHVELRVNSESQRIKLPLPAVALTQALFEETLLQVLRKEEVDLRAPLEVTAVLQTDQYVDVKAARREQLKAAASAGEERWEFSESSAIQAKFVIGADGRHSRVRQSLGIGMATGPMDRYAMFEFPSDHPPEPTLVISTEFNHCITPLAGRRARCSFQLAPEAPWMADLTFLGTLLQERAPQQELPHELDWSDIVDFEPTLAETFGRRRVWLAGDSVHSASPLGVQSMNRGISEAYQLVEAMAAVDSGTSALGEIALVSRAQREDWQRSLASDVDMELLPHAPRWPRGQLGEIMSALPVSGSDLEALLGELGIRRRSDV